MYNDSRETYSNYSFLLEKTGKKIRQFARRKFREYGFEITIDQWSVLKALYESAPLSQVDLAQRCHKDTPTVTRILDLLVQKSLAVRKSDAQDRRRQLVELSPRGSRLVKQMLPRVREIRMHAWQHLGDDDFKHFIQVLNTICQNLDD